MYTFLSTPRNCICISTNEQKTESFRQRDDFLISQSFLSFSSPLVTRIHSFLIPHLILLVIYTQGKPATGQKLRLLGSLWGRLSELRITKAVEILIPDKLTVLLRLKKTYLVNTPQNKFDSFDKIRH